VWNLRVRIATDAKIETAKLINADGTVVNSFGLRLCAQLDLAQESERETEEIT
jgi:hypothetical protein